MREAAAPHTSYAVVIPTLGRPSLASLVAALEAQDGPGPQEVVVVDDRPWRSGPARDDLVLPARVGGAPVRVLPGFGRGPAAARNLGWRVTAAPWVAFLDDDVLVPPGWSSALAADLAEAGAGVAATKGRIRVPLPADRRPTDWERSTAGLEQARWATADMAFRRSALLAVDGFDERFPRAYREDADLAARLRAAGWTLVEGTRTVDHPVRPASPHVSVRVQRGNADDALMRRLHGPRWRETTECGRGAFRSHLVVVGAAAVALASGAGVRPGRARVVAAAAAGGWAALTARFVARRVAPGPRTPAETATMVWTSTLIPPAAVLHRLRGTWRFRAAAPWRPPARAVLFDRDGTLVVDVPYNGDPSKVQSRAGAAEAVRTLREHGLGLGVVTNQSGVARGLLDTADVAAVNEAVEHAVGRFDVWQVCAHGPEDGCGCRKPAPGLVRRAAGRLGVRPEECVVIGDIGADVEAARAAGARGILVPTQVTRREEVAGAPEVATDLAAAVDLVLGGRR